MSDASLGAVTHNVSVYLLLNLPATSRHNAWTRLAMSVFVTLRGRAAQAQRYLALPCGSNEYNSELTLIFKVKRCKLGGPLNGQDNKRLQRTGISVPLIDNLPLVQLSPGR